MLDPAARQGVEIELALIEQLRHSIAQMPAYRILGVYDKLRQVRQSLQRIMALLRHQGSLWGDLTSWLPTLLLPLFPFDFLGYFALYVTLIGGCLTYATQEEVMVM